ncbi:MAG: glycerol-3-phosphate 1-O-acyltransferase PlsY [Vulcanimicrobiaceae bacterium]
MTSLAATDRIYSVVPPAHWMFPLLWLAWGWPYLLVAFALGSIPFGVFVGRAFYRSDIRTSGSGNIGAANALRTYGRKAGIAVLVLDALKGVLAIAVTWNLWLHVPLWIDTDGARIDVSTTNGPIWSLVPLAGLAAVLGHCYSPWLRFRGGKGVATYLGALLALSPAAALGFAIVWIATVLRTGFASLGSMLGAIVAGALLILGGSRSGARFDDSGFVFALGSLAVIVWKHRENLGRLRAGTENRLSLLKR